ncbi:hypothetical protein [Delftia acidovorans]|uniref:hypothetical protein n=1 Tax=Delftia acidovorans TaxID=80866 RepID=UPI0021A41036|nr:hypothetical protein [Delftia acidovorans]
MPLAWKTVPDARIAETMKTEKAGSVEEVRAQVHECQLAEQNMFLDSGTKAKSFVATPRFRAPRDGCSPDRPQQAAELDQRQERQAIPDRKGQKLGGVQPIHQARRRAPSLGGASSPRGACAPGAFSLEIDPSELDRELGGLEVSQHVAHVRGAHDDWIHFHKNLLYSNNLALSLSHHVAILLHPTADPGFTGITAVDRFKRFTE